MPTPPTEPTEPVASAPKGKKPDSPATEVGSSNWRSVVLRQARRLTDELDAMQHNAIEQAPPALMNQARDRIAAARAIAEDSSRSWATLRNWWTGNAVETAWDHLQTAREIMLGFAPSGDVRAQLPSLLRRLVAVSPDPAHDPQVDAMKATLASTGDLSPISAARSPLCMSMSALLRTITARPAAFETTSCCGPSAWRSGPPCSR